MRHRRWAVCSLVAILGVPEWAAAQGPPPPPTLQIELVNKAPNQRSVIRFDVDGHALDAHDGRIAFFEGVYYLYGTSYDCGFYWNWLALNSPFCGFKVYSSPDLTHWTDRGLLFNPFDRDWQTVCGGVQGGCFRPHVVYNAADQKYVLWVNVLHMSPPQLGYYRVFTAPTPIGPFTWDECAGTGSVTRSGLNGDQNLFVDTDGAGYIVYTHFGDPLRLVVERLDSDYLRGTVRYAELLSAADGHHEAPSLFKRDGRYYLLFSGLPSGPGAGPYGVYSTQYRHSEDLQDWSASLAISKRSCEGQPAHVTPITDDSGATTYLYHSDVWWAGDGPRSDPPGACQPAAVCEWRNQALANFHFEPLAFEPTGDLSDILCFDRVSVDVPAVYGKNNPIPYLDQTSGDQLFHAFCDIGAFSGQVRRLQVFRPARTGLLTLYVTTFQRFRPVAPLFVDVVRIVPGNVPPQVLSTHQVPLVTWSPRVHRLDTGVTVTAGVEYGFVLRAPSLTTGCFGMAYSDAGVYPAGRQLYSNNGGSTWTLEANRALKFAAAVVPLP